jgi:hypothetical protein
LIGDSFMAALQVAYEQTFAGLLERMLSEELGADVEVWNTGIPAWDAPQYRAFAERVLGQQHFDAVVAAVFLGNDVVDQDRRYIRPVQLVERHEFGWPNRWSWDGIVQAWLYPLNDRLETTSHAFVFAKRRADVLLMRLGLTGHHVQEVFLRDKTPSRRWEVTAGIFEDIRNSALRQNTPTVFVFVPSVYQLDQQFLARHAAGFGISLEDVDVEQPNRIMGEALSRRGIQVVDPLPAFRQAYQQGDELFGRIDPHLSARGHELLARTATPEILAMLKAGKAQP